MVPKRPDAATLDELRAELQAVATRLDGFEQRCSREVRTERVVDQPDHDHTTHAITLLRPDRRSNAAPARRVRRRQRWLLGTPQQRSGR